MNHEAAVIALAYARARLAAARMRVAETQAALAERERELAAANEAVCPVRDDPTSAALAPPAPSPA
jgi:hypothetical protein